jgi:3-hydroxyisobutyrate dehydrogenase-like beta-hydroxyacid dehydrogenase
VAGLRVAVLGLGEAGSAIASDLLEAGCDVRGFDPDAGRAEAVPRAPTAAAAVKGADAVLSVNLAVVALDVARDVCHALVPGQVYADLNTAAPALKTAVEHELRPSGALFADVAIVDTVPGNGIRAAALVSGPGAERFAELFGPLGMPVDVVGSEAGEAAMRKLVRSVFVKGLAAAMMESLAAGETCGIDSWVRGEILRVLDGPGGRLVERLLTGTRLHAVRRREEMAAAAELLAELGVEPRVSRAAEGWLEEIAAQQRESARPPATR